MLRSDLFWLPVVKLTESCSIYISMLHKVRILFKTILYNYAGKPEDMLWLNNSLFHPSEIKIPVQASTVGWKPPLFIAVQKSSSSPISTLSRGTMIETCWSPLGGWLISSQSDEKFILPGSAYLELPAKPHYIFWKNSTLIFVFSSEDTDGASTAGIYFFFLNCIHYCNTFL